MNHNGSGPGPPKDLKERAPEPGSRGAPLNPQGNGSYPVLRSRQANTPCRIVTRARGVQFYCTSCLKTYWQCSCPVYQSADTLRGGKNSISGPGKGHSRGWLKDL